MTTIGVSNFAKTRHQQNAPYSHFGGTWEQLVKIAEEYFGTHKPSFRDGVVEVSVPADGFFTSIVDLNEASVLKAEWRPRQPGEMGQIHTNVMNATKSPAKVVKLILYSAAALSENNGERSTECDWEIVSINASPMAEGNEPMTPMAMARNFLELPGGTKTQYTAEEFARAVVYWHTHAMVG